MKLDLDNKQLGQLLKHLPAKGRLDNFDDVIRNIAKKPL